MLLWFAPPASLAADKTLGAVLGGLSRQIADVAPRTQPTQRRLRLLRGGRVVPIALVQQCRAPVRCCAAPDPRNREDPRPCRHDPLAASFGHQTRAMTSDFLFLDIDSVHTPKSIGDAEARAVGCLDRWEMSDLSTASTSSTDVRWLASRVRVYEGDGEGNDHLGVKCSTTAQRSRNPGAIEAALESFAYAAQNFGAGVHVRRRRGSGQCLRRRLRAVHGGRPHPKVTGRPGILTWVVSPA